MPNIKSQMKRVKTSQQANLRNSSKMSTLRTKLKKAGVAISENSENKDILYKDAVNALNSANSQSLLHKNTVSRKISRLTKSYNNSKK